MADIPIMPQIVSRRFTPDAARLRRRKTLAKTGWAIFGWIALTISAAHAQALLYVVNQNSGTIGEYDATSGTAVSASLISGLTNPENVAVLGPNLYVLSGNTIGEYNATTGAAVNASFITGLSGPLGMAISGANLYVANLGSGTIGEYNAFTGAAINASLVTGVTPAGIAVSGPNLYIANNTAGTIGEYNATTGAVVNASLVSGLGTIQHITVLGSNLYVTEPANATIGVYNATTGALVAASLTPTLPNPQGTGGSGSNLYIADAGDGTIDEYNATTGAVVTTSLVSGLNAPVAVAVIDDGSDVGGIQAQKGINYVQTGFTTPALNPDHAYQFQVNVNPGDDELLTSSVLTPPSGSTGTVSFQNGIEGLSFTAQFQTLASMTAAFADGTYGLTVQTTTPNAYPDTFSITGDGYPTIPTLVSVTNGTWVNGHLQITDPTQPTVFTWTPYVSGTGSVSFNLNNSSVGTFGPAIATNNSFTIPAGTFASNTAYQANLNFTNASSETANFGISTSTQYATQTQFLIYTGTPTLAATTINTVGKTHVLFQSSNSAPVNGSGDINYTDAAPYNFKIQSATSGTVTGPAGGLTLGFSASNGSNNNNALYRYESAAIANQATLDTTYPDGNYTFADTHVLALTGDNYPNTPQVTQVNGATPTWNSQGQLVLDPTIDNVITWTPFSVIATTFTAQGHEDVSLNSVNDSSVSLEQKAGFSEASTVTFNTLTIPANTMTGGNTYVGELQYHLGSSVVSPSANVYDFAGYATETNFTVAAAPSGTAAQTINFAAIPSQQVVNTSVTLVASTSSGLPVTFSVVTGPATVTGNTLSFTGTGTVIVEASQNGNSIYAAASPQSQNITVNTTSSSGIDQFITFPAISSPQNAGLPLTLNATASSGLPITYTVTTGPATVNGNVLTFTGTGSVTVNADQPGDGSFSAAGTQSQTFQVNAPVDVTNLNIQKQIQYDQSSAAAPALDPDQPYEFSANVNAGSTGALLSTSTLTPSSSGTATTVPFQAGINGLSFNENFITKAAMDAAFAPGTYNFTLQTTTPNTYATSTVLSSDNYPSVIPEITSVTNANWTNGRLVVVNPALPVTFTWPSFTSAIGNINFEIDSNSSTTPIVSQSFAPGTTSFMLPGNSLTTTAAYYQASLSFGNYVNAGGIPGANASAGYQYQVEFAIQVGTPASSTATRYVVYKANILKQTSGGVPVNDPANTGDTDNVAPYGLKINSPVAGTTTGPTSTNYTLNFAASSGNNDSGQYEYSSGPVSSMATLNSTYPDGNYTLADGVAVGLTGEVYPNVPQVTAVNSAPPIWNSQGQLVLDPAVMNVITFTAVNQSAGTFASNGHEDVQFESTDDNSIDIEQQSGVTESSTTSFNTLTIPPNTMTLNATYSANISYFLASAVNFNAGTQVYSIAGYQTETTFTAVAQTLGAPFSPTFNSSSDVGITSNGYIATGQTLTVNLGFAPTAGTVLTLVSNTSSTPIVGTFAGVPEGSAVTATFNSTNYTFTITYHGGNGNDITLTYTPPTPPSSLTILHEFADGSVPNDGTIPLANLIQGTDGNFYGTTQLGGAANEGTVFKITPAGQVTILHSFRDGSVNNDGENPAVSLVQGPDGNFYGTTQFGGSATNGCVYKITPQGQLTILHNFSDGSVPNDGSEPLAALILGSDGNFYGTTFNGGSSSQAGIVFKITPQGQLTILHDFADGSVPNDGTGPQSPLVQGSDGNFYSTTITGGSVGKGTVYKISQQGQVTILHSFGDGSVVNDGLNPMQEGLLQGPDGNFYGTTNFGGVGQGFGTVYKISSTGTITILHRFNDGSVLNDGQLPIGNLILGLDGNYYGMTEGGGSNTALQDVGTGEGTIFSMTPQGVVTILHSFQDGSVQNDGQSPQAGLIQASDGTFYGTTQSGGTATNAGVVFKFFSGLPVFTSPLTASGTVSLPFSYQTLATNMPTIYSAMNLPPGLSINAATGLITGTPTAPGSTVTVITASNSKGPSSVSVTFNIMALPAPVVTSILQAYGTVGTLFSYTASATNNPTSFAATYNGSSTLPSNLSLTASSGVISGTPSTPGTYTISLTATNSFTTSSAVTLTIQIFATVPTVGQEYNILHQFGDGSVTNDGANPTAIFQGFDGTFYGITTAGGTYNGTAYPGTIFNITSQGQETVPIFHAFGTSTFVDGFSPQGLLQAADGNFYGTTNTGGSVNLGTIFKITSQGTEVILHSFGDGSVLNDGSSPQSAGVVQGADGNFYGTTQSGGSAGLGTVYKITPLGVVTILHSFGDGSVANDGASPKANLLQGTDGNFYGTTQAGGSNSAGTLFKITPLGTMTILHSFQSGTVLNVADASITDGANPVAPLIEGLDGNFYGTTQNGGSHGTGTVFQLTSTGTFTILHSFGDGSVTGDGANPEAPLLQADDGNFYGTTYQGGSSNEGTVFEITSTGTESLVHEFGSVTNDGSSPNAGLFQDANGNFYGTTSIGGVGYGTIFTFVTTQPTTHVPVFTGANSLFSPALTPLSFTPKALFGISSTGITGSAVPQSFFSQLIHKFFSSSSDWILSGTLPQFLTFDSTSGTISGTPVQAGTYTITMTAVNAQGDGSPQTVTLYIDVAPVITSASTATGTAGTPFTYQIAGNASPTSFGATGLPGWLSVNTTTGAITGTPPGDGTYVFSPTATNVSGTGTQTVTLTVTGGDSSAPAVTSATTASATVGTAFSYQITASNGPTSYGALSLPSGILFDSTTGIISGTPTTSGTYSISISATNGSGTSSSVLALTVAAVTAPTITSCSAISCTPSTVISYQITGTNSPTTFSAQGLPAGLTLDSTTGTISGTTTDVGTSMVSISATNNVGTGTSTLALTVETTVTLPTLASSPTASSAVTLPFSYQIGVGNTTGGTNTYDATGLPPGLSINPTTGEITGTPTSSGNYPVVLYITNSLLGTGTATLNLTVGNPTFSQWATLYPNNSVPNATPKNDGVPNVLKYLYDIDPTQAMSATDRAALPTLSTTKSGGTTYLNLTYRQYALESGLSISVITSSDLKTWTTATNAIFSQIGTDATTGDPIMQAQMPTSGTKTFVRLNVTSQ